MAEPRRKDDRLFVRAGRRSYRRRFSVAEARWGVAVLAALAAVWIWVVWKGRHPDPALFAAGLGAESAATVAVDGTAPSASDRSAAGGGVYDADGAPRSSGATAAASVGPNPFPPDLTAQGWRAGLVTQYDSTNLYVKIDGREDYYKSFGFRRLHWVSLSSANDPALTVDIELFDMGNAANALGAYAGERPPEIAPQLEDSGMWHRARNAGFATLGRYYARLVGADESPAVLEQVDHARRALARALPPEPLPWGYALFSGGMGVDPGRVAYVTENAFSLGFARDVYTAKLDDSDLEAFVVATANADAARSLAEQFVTGFAEYGEDAGRAHGLQWVQDRNVHTFATATGAGAWVVGVRGAGDPAQGAAAVARMRKAVAAAGAIRPAPAVPTSSAGGASTEPES